MELAFEHAGLEWQKHVRTSTELFRPFRPAEGNVLLGDASKTRSKLGWRPKTRFPELVKEIVEANCGALGIAVGRGTSAEVASHRAPTVDVA